MAQLLVVVLYVRSFLVMQRLWLADARACLNIREAYLKDPGLIFRDPFLPLRPIQAQDRSQIFQDRHLWFLFWVTIFTAVAMVTYVVIA